MPNIQLNVSDFTQNPLSVRNVVVTPIYDYTVAGASLITSDRVSQQTDSNGSVTFGNMLSGGYRVDFSGPYKVSSIIINVPSGSGTLNAKDLIGVPLTGDAYGTAYTKAQSDANYLSTGQTGQLASAANLALTGNAAQSMVNSLSGVVNSNYLTQSTLLNATGVNLQGQVNTLTTWTGQTPSKFLALTGYQTISGIKYFADTTSGIMTQQITSASAANKLTMQGAYTAFYLGGVISTDFGNRNLIDNVGDVGVNWNTRLLYSTSIPTLDWQNQLLTGNWQAGGLYVSGNPVLTGGVVTLSTNQTILGQKVFAGTNTTFSGASGIIANTVIGTGFWANYSNIVDVNNTQLFSDIPGPTLNWTSRSLTGTWNAQGLTVSGVPVITTGQTGAFISSSQWSYLTCAPTTTWTVKTNVAEDRRILVLTGTTTLSLSGLYNGWAGVLETIQSGSGYNVTLPANTKVAYNGSGALVLTTGISGAIDMIALTYDGVNLFANVANRWT